MGVAEPPGLLVPGPVDEVPAGTPPEFAAFLDEPAQMRSGAVGKSGVLRLGFERRSGTTILAGLESRAPLLAQRALYCDETLPDMAWLFMITTAGCILQGDRMALEVSLGAGARAHLTTQSATKIHAMEANYALQTQAITLGEEAYLEFLPDPLIPHRNARFAMQTRVVVAPSASLVASEVVQPGRKYHHAGECFGVSVLSLATRAERPDGRLLFSEKLLIEPGRRAMRQTGVMDGFDVFGNVLVCTPPQTAQRIHDRAAAEVDFGEGIAYGACRLPNEAGLVYRVLGRETGQVKDAIHAFWSLAREEITGVGAPARFFWQ